MKRSLIARAALIAGIVLIAAALALTGYNIITEELAGRERDVILTELDELIPSLESTASPEGGADSTAEAPTFEEIKERHIEHPDNSVGVYVPKMPTVTVDGKDYIGKLSMPSIKLEVPVLSDWSYDDLKIAPCLYYGSVYTNDMVLCAHNYRTHFGQIGRLARGSKLTFTDAEGNEYFYKVVNVEIVKPDDTRKLVNGKYDLTLFTCTLSGGKRTVIRCELLSVNGTPVSKIDP